MTRRFLYLLSAAVIVWAGLIVPLPLSAVAPGTAPSIPPLLHIASDTTPVNGDLKLLTVVVSQPSIIETAIAWWDDDIELNRRQTFIPEGFTRQEYFQLQRQDFQRSGTTATVVAMQLAGHEVVVHTRPAVSTVIAQSPADGVLQPGDLILAVNGEAVETADDMVTKSRRAEAGERIELRIQRGEAEQEVHVTVSQVRGMSRPGIGVQVETIVSDLEPPFEVALDPDISIGGPSAGMMIAVTIYDLVSEDDIAAGRVIVGTGEVLPDGSVMSIGGIREKVRSAVDAGADVLLVPEQQLLAARATAPEDLEVIGVANVREAIEALGGTPN